MFIEILDRLKGERGPLLPKKKPEKELKKIRDVNFEKAKPTLFLFKDEVYGNSEPQVTVIDNIEYLISFINNEDKSYIALINIQNNNYEKIEIPTRVPPGFHSIYYKKPN